MSLQMLFQQIESEEFTAKVNIASTRKVFLSALSEEPAFETLLELLDNQKNVTPILSRIRIHIES